MNPILNKVPKPFTMYLLRYDFTLTLPQSQMHVSDTSIKSEKNTYMVCQVYNEQQVQ